MLTPLESPEKQIFSSADELFSNYKMTSAVWKVNRCHKSIKAAASEDYSPNRLREPEQGQGSIPTSLDTNLKSLRVIHLAAGAGPRALVMSFMLLLPILSQHSHPGYIYPPNSLTHLICHYTAPWKVCFLHKQKAVKQQQQQIFLKLCFCFCRGELTVSKTEGNKFIWS